MHKIRSKIHQNALAAGAPPQAPLGELKTLPQTPLPEALPQTPLGELTALPQTPLPPREKSPHNLKRSTFQKSAPLYQILDPPLLDADDINSYRPISNLSLISKLVERVVASRFVAHAE